MRIPVPFNFSFHRITAESKEDKYDRDSSDCDAEFRRTCLQDQNEQLNCDSREAEEIEFEETNHDLVILKHGFSASAVISR